MRLWLAYEEDCIQRALLGKRKLGSKVYLSAIAMGLGVCLGKKIFVFFLAWMPLGPLHAPSSYVSIRIQSAFYAGLARGV